MEKTLQGLVVSVCAAARAWLVAALLLAIMPLGSGAQVLRGTFAAGFGYSLAVRPDGTLWASGDNTAGQLGDGTTTHRSGWVQVGTATNWVQVAAGDYHSLGLRADGTLWAWGLNLYGQLGVPTNAGSIFFNPNPLQVAGTFTQIAAGGSHSLALKADGSLWTWGQNYYGQLGYLADGGTNRVNATLAQVAGTYTQISGGGAHSLALRANGSLWAWGLNQFGQLGVATNSGTITPNTSPAQVAGTYVQVSAGADFSLALRADGSLWAWGNNQYGQLGVATNSGTITANPSPAQVAGTYTQAAAGAWHGLALQATGSLYAWGRNDACQLGSATNNGTDTPNPGPTVVAGTYTQAAGGRAP